MRKFLTLMKTLTAFRMPMRKRSVQPGTLSIAHRNTETVCNAITTTTNEFIHDTSNDPGVPGSFFLPEDNNNTGKLIGLLIIEEENTTTEKQRKKDDKKNTNSDTPVIIMDPGVIVPVTVSGKGTPARITKLFWIHPSSVISRLRRFFKKTGIFIIGTVLTNFCFHHTTNAQTGAVSFDLPGNSSCIYRNVMDHPAMMKADVNNDNNRFIGYSAAMYEIKIKAAGNKGCVLKEGRLKNSMVQSLIKL